MASRPVHIDDFAAGIASGEIPAKLVSVGKVTSLEFPAVETVNSRGARLVWRIWVSARRGGDPVSLDAGWLAPGALVPPDVHGVIETESHQVSKSGVVGKIREGGHATIVTAGKNLGKRNATNPVTQAVRDALGRYNTQLRRSSGAAAASAAPPAASAASAASPAASTASAASAASPAASASPGSLPPPMLVKRHGSAVDATLTPRNFAEGVTVQRKYNGVRLVAYLRGDQVAMYSRSSSEYPGFASARADLRAFLSAPPRVPPEMCEPLPGCSDAGAPAAVYETAQVYLDGELYLHGKGLQWISGQARKANDEGTLTFVVFDCFFPAAIAAGYDMPSARRQEYLDLLFRKNGRASQRIVRADNWNVSSLEEIESLSQEFVANGYEGAIARKNCAGYQYGANGYHSSNLLKFKPIYDSEFPVVAFATGEKGKDAGALIWVCAAGDTTFRVVPKDMTYKERYKIAECLGLLVPNTPAEIAKGGAAHVTRFERDFKGKPMTVEYPELSSKTGKPVQAKALGFRTYEDGSEDPVSRLFAECRD